MGTRKPLIAALILITAGGAAGAQEFAANHIYSTALGSGRVRELDLNGALVREIETNAGSASFVYLTFGPDGKLIITNTSAGSLLSIPASGVSAGAIGAQAGLAEPRGFAFGGGGRIFVTSESPARVVELDAQGNKIRDLAENAGLASPAAVAVAPGANIYISSTGTNSIIEIDPAGAKVGEIAHLEMLAPSSLHFGPDGKLYVLSPPTGRIFIFNADGTLLRQLGAGISWAAPSAMVPGPDGNLYVLDPQLDRIFVITANGGAVREIGGVGGGSPATNLAISPVRFRARVTGARRRGRVAGHVARRRDDQLLSGRADLNDTIRQ